MKTTTEFLYDLFMHKKALQMCFSILDLDNVNAVYFTVDDTGTGHVSIGMNVRATSTQIQVAQLGVYYHVDNFNTDAKLHKAWSITEEDRLAGEIAAGFSVSYDGNYTTNPDSVTRLGVGRPTFLLRKEKDIAPRQAKLRAQRINRQKWIEFKHEGGLAAGGIH